MAVDKPNYKDILNSALENHPAFSSEEEPADETESVDEAGSTDDE